MQIQPVASQPNFEGKVVFEPGTTTQLTKYMPNQLWRKFKQVATLVAEKPYDIFISSNKQAVDFYDVAANKTFEDAQKIKEYTVKVESKAMAESIIEAAKEAMDMYEKYIAKGIKG